MPRLRPFYGWDYIEDIEKVWTREEAQEILDKAHSFDRAYKDTDVTVKNARGIITHQIYDARIVGKTIAHN